MLAYLLSSEENVEEFKSAFDLSDETLADVLAAVRNENRTLATELAESERLVAAGKEAEASTEEIRRKVDASDFEEEVESAVADTKSTVEALPGVSELELQTWVDAQWQDEVRQNTAASSVVGTAEPGAETSRAARRGKRGIRCRVYATQYDGFTRYEVAVPHFRPKFKGGQRVGIRRANGSHPTRAPVKEVGPWNTRDNYWQPDKKRTMWRKLPRCKPEAQAAYFRNFNRGRDQFSRKVLNPAGVDLTPPVARKLGLRKFENAWVLVRFPWAR